MYASMHLIFTVTIHVASHTCVDSEGGPTLTGIFLVDEERGSVHVITP